MNKEALCVIVPDVHGRTFWKDVSGFDCDIIFLGDYLDPYGFETEGIADDAVDNFIEILDFAAEHDNVTLLLGNHDCEYLIGTYVCDCRCDYNNFDEIRDLFLKNSSRFKFAVSREYNGNRFLFSHAGFHPNWFSRHPEFDIEYLCNAKYSDDIEFDRFTDALCDVSRYRGGYSQAGSPIWADIREYEPFKADLESYGVNQICGHTYLKESPVAIANLTCVDLRRIFLIDKSGILCEKDFTPAKWFRV